ncbi:MAG: hypothetical protein RIG63_18130 [Coleofasciculus chthonoplastes F3-SA18-01]
MRTFNRKFTNGATKLYQRRKQAEPLMNKDFCLFCLVINAEV